jgi:hypothetical protein
MKLGCGVVAILVCAGLGCGSSGTGASGKDAGGSDAGSAADGQPGAPSDGAARSDGADGLTLEMCPAGKAHYDAAAFAEVRCSTTDDTDHDGLNDCADGCPYDGTKIAPGVCGCNTPDVDSDGDGVPDCIDDCPLDPNNIRNGQCGCVGEPGLEPAGTACSDQACPQQGATCNGAGVCGDRSACSPCPGGRYLVSPGAFRRYWLCGAILPPITGPGCSPEDGGTGGGAATRAAAQSACQAKGLTLARIDTLDDNRFVTQLLTVPLWIGANDLQTPGDWYWPSSTSDSAELFWSGSADGSRQNGAFTDWAGGAPGANSCATIRTDSYWVDTSCSETHGYICEYQLF